MSLELVKKEVDGKVYEFEQFGSKLSIKTFLRLKKIIGKSLAMATGISKEDSDGNKYIDQDLFAKAIESFAEHSADEEVIDLLETLCANKVLCEGKKIDFNSHYCGKFSHMINVAKAAVEVQYGDFFGGSLGGLV